MSLPSVDPSLIGYCTNVHAGKDLPTTMQQLETHAVAVRQQLQQQELAVGLWLSNETAKELISEESAIQRFSDWLENHGLIPYTMNGFPYGDFHQEVVKLDVYKPTWADASRLDYTKDLCRILAKLLQVNSASKDRQKGHGLPTGMTEGSQVGTISTLPIGWPSNDDETTKKKAAAHLLSTAEFLAHLHETTGTLIKLCIEPEPGCILGDFQSTLQYFQDYLLNGDVAQRNRAARYLTICYDICHSAVMNESAEENLKQMVASGVSIGKVQVSSAVTVDFEALPADKKQAAMQRIRSFSEPRYMHQTTVALPEEPLRYFNDLPDALSDPQVDQRGRWTIHFHVPISQADAGILQTTQSEITRFIAAASHHDVHPIHWEVETYAWNVLPKDMQVDSLATGIADEIRTLQNWLIK